MTNHSSRGTGDRVVSSRAQNESKALSTLSQKSATVAEFGDCRRFLRQSHFSATVWTGLKTDQHLWFVTVVCITP